MDAVKGEMDRIRRLCVSIKHFAPNLKVIRFYLFCNPKPEVWFLLKLVDYVNCLPGKRMIIVQGSNREKYRIAGIFKRNHQCFGEPSPGRRLHLLPVHASARESIQ